MSPKLLIGLLVVLVVFVGVNALLAQQQQKPKLSVVQGGAQNTPAGKGQSGLGSSGAAAGGLGGGGGSAW